MRNPHARVRDRTFWSTDGFAAAVLDMPVPLDSMSRDVSVEAADSLARLWSERPETSLDSALRR
jgi:hypothetical protein